MFNPLVCDGFGLDLNSTQLRRFNSVVKRFQILITFWLWSKRRTHQVELLLKLSQLATWHRLVTQPGKMGQFLAFFESVSSPHQPSACSLHRRPWRCTLLRPAKVQSDSSACCLAADLDQALQLSSACFLAADLDEKLQLSSQSATKGHDCCGMLWALIRKRRTNVN